jgi:protein involved in ribonucleotide reduction
MVRIEGKADQVLVSYVELRPVRTSKTVTKVVDGKNVTERVIETINRPYNRQMVVSLAGAKGQLASGKKLTAEEVAKAMEKPQVVVLSIDGNPVDRAYLQLLKPDTLIIEAKPVGGVGGRGGVAPVPLPVPVPAPAPAPKPAERISD